MQDCMRFSHDSVYVFQVLDELDQLGDAVRIKYNLSAVSDKKIEW